MLQAFVENYPQFRKLKGAVSKHVAVVGEMSRIVDQHKLMALSEAEQDVVTGSDKATAMKVRVYSVCVCMSICACHAHNMLGALSTVKVRVHSVCVCVCARMSICTMTCWEC